MSELVDKNAIYNKINEIFLEGLVEPEYASSNTYLDEEFGVLIVRDFFDKEGQLRKKCYEKNNGLPQTLDLYDADGNLLCHASSEVRVYEPIVEIYKYLYDGTENENLVSRKKFGLNIETKDVSELD